MAGAHADEPTTPPAGTPCPKCGQVKKGPLIYAPYCCGRCAEEDAPQTRPQYQAVPYQLPNMTARRAVPVAPMPPPRPAYLQQLDPVAPPPTA